MKVRALERSDDRSDFGCGNPSLDAFLIRYAWQNQVRHHLGVTYVAVDDGTRRVLGFFTLAAASVSAESVPERSTGGRYREIPVLRIARLAVDRRVQGVGVGRELLHAALRVAAEYSTSVGCAGVMVDALSESADFYERHGFRSMAVLAGGSSSRPRPTPMFLAMGTILAATR